MSDPCQTCGGARQVKSPASTEFHLEPMPCPTCRRVVSVEFVKAADALAAAGGVPEREWIKLVAAYRAAAK